MKKLSILLLFISFSSLQLAAEDYQYQYFSEKKKYVPFSDYIPKVRLHYKTVPHYVEDYYLLYSMKQHYNENSLRKNITRLELALQCKFRHPSEALIKIETEKEYLKYRRLLFMHINLLIMRNYLKIATRYDKQKIYFYNLEFSKEIRESLDIAEKYYRKAIPFWKRAKKLAADASRIKITTDLGKMESERFRIITKDLNYDRIINRHLTKLSRKKNRLDNYLAKKPG